MSRSADLWDKAARYRRMLVHTTDDRTRKVLEETIRDLEKDAARLLAMEDQPAPAGHIHEVYTSENGDRWFLTTGESGTPRVLHRSNAASGGNETGFELDTFLTTNGRHTPQHQGLLRCISLLVSKCP